MIELFGIFLSSFNGLPTVGFPSSAFCRAIDCGLLKFDCDAFTIVIGLNTICVGCTAFDGVGWMAAVPLDDASRLCRCCGCATLWLMLNGIAVLDANEILTFKVSGAIDDNNNVLFINPLKCNEVCPSKAFSYFSTDVGKIDIEKFVLCSFPKSAPVLLSNNAFAGCSVVSLWFTAVAFIRPKWIDCCL